MQSVELLRAERGAKKVSCSNASQEHCGLGLAAAKGVTDAMLGQEKPTVSLPNRESARALIVTLAELGVVARFAEGPDYNPQQSLASAIEPLRSKLLPQVLQSCESLAAHGEWELALSHCLAHLPSTMVASEMAALCQLSIEFGIVSKRGQ